MSVTGLVLPDLVELGAERKMHVRPTSASIAEEAELVLPGAGCQARAPRPAEQPTHEVHIHVRPSGPTDLQEGRRLTP